MNSFGLTYLGPQSAFASTLRKNLCLDDVTDEMLMTGFIAFDARYKKDGLLCSNDMKPLLIQVYGREPPELEVQLFIEQVEKVGSTLKSNTGIETSAKYIDANEFAQIIQEVRKKLAESDTNTATEFKSAEELVRSKYMGHASTLGPKDKYRVPVVTSHDYGWSTAQPFERVERKPKKACDETRYASEMVKGGLI